MKRLIITSIILLVFYTFSQAQLGKANRFYDRYEYAFAIPEYLKVIEANKKGVDEAILKLADCYRFTSEFEEAEKWYAKAITLENIPEITYFYYAQVLQSEEKYDEAKQWFLVYDSIMPSDPRGGEAAIFMDKIKNLTRDEEVVLTNLFDINTEYSDFSPMYYKNGLVFSSDRPIGNTDDKKSGWTGASFMDIFYSEFAVANEKRMKFSPPRLLSEKINKSYHDAIVTFNDEHDQIYFTRAYRDRGKVDSTGYYTSTLRIYVSDFKYDKWRTPKEFPLNNDNYSVGHPTLLNDSILYFVSDMPGGKGSRDIYVTHYSSVNRKWTEPKNLGDKINTWGKEMFPYIFNDTLLFFSSDGHAGFGGLDLFYSVKKNGEWQEPVNLMAPINSPKDDFGLLFNESREYGYLSSNRDGGLGMDDIYYFVRIPKPPPPPPVIHIPPDSVTISGIVKNKESLLPINAATVFLWNKTTDNVKVIKTDVNGKYAEKVKIGEDYLVKAMNTGFIAAMLNTSISDTLDVALNDLLLGQFKKDQVFRLEKIYYDFNKWDIRPDAAAELNKVIRFLEQYPEITIELGSHTDSRGSFTYNQSLSEKRAQSAVNYIIENGISKNRITAKGYGESMLVNECRDGVNCSDEKHQENRRTEIKITGVITSDEELKQISLDRYEDGKVYKRGFFNESFFSVDDIGGGNE